MILNTNTRTHTQTHTHTHIYLHVGRLIRDNERDLVFFFLPVFEFAATTAKIGHSGRGKIPMESWNTKPSGEVRCTQHNGRMIQIDYIFA